MAGVGPVVERVIVGTLSGIEPKSNGWMKFSLMEDGKQYPVKCETKKPDSIAQATALLGQRVKILLGEQLTDNINSNTGKPFINRYLNQIAVAGPQDVGSGEPLKSEETALTTQSATADWGTGTTVTQPQSAQQAAYTDYARDLSPTATLRIMRMGASERATEMAAAGMLPAEQQTMEGLVGVAEAWVAYYTYGAARFGVPAFDAGVAHQEAQPQDTSPKVCEKCGYDDPQHAAGCPNEFPAGF